MSASERARRIVENEQLFEAVNAAVRQVNTELGIDDETEHYVCECSMQECTQRIALTREEYLEARENPARFFMLAAHRDPAHEHVVRETDRYVLVEKED
jgi:hypothetical protein